MKKTTQYLVGAAAAVLASSALAVPVVLDILTDDFAGETSFEMAIMLGGTNIAYDSWTSPTDLANADLDDGFVSGGDMLSATAYQFTWDLAAGSYEFTIFDSFGDGICCGFGIGDYTLSVNGSAVVSGGDFGFQETTGFTIDPPTGISEPGVLVLFGLGVMGLALSRRLRHA